MMIGSPYQTLDNLLNDLEFLSDFQPHMIGTGPFYSRMNKHLLKIKRQVALI